MRAPLLLCSVLLACAAAAKRETSPDRVAPVCDAAMPTSVESDRPPDAERPAALLLRNARLIDGTGAKPREKIDVLVEGDRIAKIGASLSAPNDARVIDLDGRA